MSVQEEPNTQPPAPVSRCIDWYHEGETRIVVVDGFKVTIRFISRKGRRARIAIIAPAGATFLAPDAAERPSGPNNAQDP